MITPGLYPEVDEAEYHADPSSLSVSGAKLLLKCPALYRWRTDNPQESERKDYFDVGSAAHALVLGIGAPIQVIDFPDWRSGAAKAARDEARLAGQVPLLQHDYDRVRAMAGALLTHPVAEKLFADGEAEVSAYAQDRGTGVLRRGRFDWLNPWAVVDYKTTVSAAPADFAKACANYGYDMQASWYLDLCDLLGEPRETFVFVAQEKEPPYLAEVYELDDAALERGDRRNRRALELYAHCQDTDVWPGYAMGEPYMTLSLPRWALMEEGIR